MAADGERRRITPRDLEFNPAIIEGGAPVAVFWLVNQFGDARLAILLSFATAIVVFARNRDSGVIRFLGVVGFVVVAISAIVGLVLDSDKAFAAQNIASDILAVPLALGTILIGKPLVGLVAREMVPAIRPYLAVNHTTFIWLTLITVFTNGTTAVIRFFMLDALSTNDYVILSRLLGIPFNVVYFALCYAWIKRDVERLMLRDEAPAPVPTIAGGGS